MQKWKKVCIGLMLCGVTGVSAQTDSYKFRAEKYIEQFKQLAIEEQKRSGIPAAITLAQGIHETAAGNSELALNANNHFGIKCKKEWQGPTYTYTDDAPDECFRKYSKAYDSYKDHSDYLSASARYASLFQLPKTDYAGWATGLKRCGYATNPKYAQVLIKLVEDYNLQEYTYAAMKEDYNPYKDAQRASDRKQSTAGEVVPERDAPVVNQGTFDAPGTPVMAQTGKKKKIQVSYGDEPQKKSQVTNDPILENAGTPEYDKLVKVSGLRAFYAKKGTVLLNEALRYNIRYAKLLELNDLPDGPLEADMYIYLDKKNIKGINQTHLVKEGETVTQIAQAEAIQLKYLKFYNHIGSNEEPVPGAVLQLQQYKEEKPQTYVKFVAPKEEPVFAGSNPKPVPQGATRVRASYIKKKDIAKQEGEHEVGAEEIVKEEPKTQQRAEERQEPVEVKEEIRTKIPVQEPETPTVAEQPAPSVPEPQVAAVITETPAPKEEIKTEETKPAIPENQIKTTESSETAGMPVPVVITPTVAQPTIPVPAQEEKAVVQETKPAVAELAKTEQVGSAEQKLAGGAEAAPLVTEAANKPEEKQPELAREEVKPTTTLEPVAPVTPQPELNAEAVAAVEITPSKAEETNPAPKVETTPVVAEEAKEAKVPEVLKAGEVAAEEKPKEEPEEPADDYSRLKAKLDRVVYASDKAVPAVEAKTEEKKEEPAPPAPKPANGYTVKKGETAYSIAKKHKISLRQLMEWNKLQEPTVKEGMQLRVK
jgi:LysM repeat protein